MDPGYDVIGDVHGEGTKLIGLLDALGYEERGGQFMHRDRRAVFVGDLIDRGAEQRLVVETVRPMVESGAAFVVMGNHEFNAIAFHTKDPSGRRGHLRERSEKNRAQHRAFTNAVGLDSVQHGELVEWFGSMPMWFERDGLRVVHACWDDASMATMDGPLLNHAELVAASEDGSPQHQAVEVLLKGPEIPIDPGYRDKDGHVRSSARHAWWVSDPDGPLDRLVVPGGVTLVDGSATAPWPGDVEVSVGEPTLVPYPAADPPVIFGHYWRTGPPALTSVNTACVDYSACKGGPLVAYRWSGESVLRAENFVSAEAPR